MQKKTTDIAGYCCVFFSKHFYIYEMVLYKQIIKSSSLIFIYNTCFLSTYSATLFSFCGWFKIYLTILLHLETLFSDINNAATNIFESFLFVSYFISHRTCGMFKTICYEVLIWTICEERGCQTHLCCKNKKK